MPKEKPTIRSLIDEHDLMRWQVADMLEVSIRTVDGWLLPPNSTHHRNAPPMAARLLDRLCKEEKRSKKMTPALNYGSCL